MCILDALWGITSACLVQSGYIFIYWVQSGFTVILCVRWVHSVVFCVHVGCNLKYIVFILGALWSLLGYI